MVDPTLLAYQLDSNKTEWATQSDEAECARASRFVHTPEGWQEWLTHTGDCRECQKDLEYFEPNAP